MPLRDLLAGGIDLENKSHFSVVIAYEDYAAGACAKKTYDHLLHTFGGNLEFNHTMWCFDALRIGELRQAAADEATQSDLVIIATGNRSDLPAEVKFWIEAWLEQKKPRLNALAALIEDRADGSAANTVAIHDYLREISWRGQMNFFFPTSNDSWFAHRPSMNPALTVSGHVDTVSEEIWEEVESSSQQWGINE